MHRQFVEVDGRGAEVAPAGPPPTPDVAPVTAHPPPPVTTTAEPGWSLWAELEG